MNDPEHPLASCRVQHPHRHLEAQESGSICERRARNKLNEVVGEPMKCRSFRLYRWTHRRQPTYRISVGVNPRVNALMPSVLQVVLTQSHVDLYFCPVAGENPSVCIRDLIMSIGYMTAQSYDPRKEKKKKKLEPKTKGTETR